MADIILNKPEAGTQAVFEAAGDSRIDLNFPTDQATLERSGNDLIFRFDDGSTVVLRDFYTAYTKDSMPDFVIEGTPIAGEQFFTALNEPDLMPAAGPAANAASADGGRFREYADDALINGVNRLDGLDLSSNRAFFPERDPWGGLRGDDTPNYAPTLSVSGSLGVIESGVFPGGNELYEGVPSMSGRATGTDANGDTLSFGFIDANGAQVTSIVTPYGVMAMAPDGTYTYTIDNADPDTNGLALGETRTETFTVYVSDGRGGLATQEITVTLTGTNDRPELSIANAAQGIHEDTASVGGTFAVQDPDSDSGQNQTFHIEGGSNTPAADGTSPSDGSHSATGSTDATFTTDYGKLTLDPATGQWTYALNNASDKVQQLNAGETKVETFEVTVTDEHGATSTQTITVTITGTNDIPVIDTDQSNFHLDFKEQGVYQPSENGDGNTPTTPGGTGEGQHQTGTLSGKIFASDADKENGAGSTEHDVNKLNFHVEHAGSSLTDGGASTTVTGTGTPGTGDVVYAYTSAYGTLTFRADGSYEYTLNNKNPGEAGADSNAVNNLALGQTVTETFTVYVTDAQTGRSVPQTITVTINGTNDVPTLDLSNDNLNDLLGGDGNLHVVEDGVGRDNANTPTDDPGKENTPFTGHTTDTGTASGNDVDAGHILYFGAAAGENTKTFDPSVFNTADSTATGGAASSVVAGGQYGSLTINSNGSYTYAMKGEGENVSFELDGKTYTSLDQLAEGDTIYETFTIYVRDEHNAWTAKTVTVAIHGTNDIPTLDITGSDWNITQGGDLSIDGTFTVTDNDRDAGTDQAFHIAGGKDTSGTGTDGAHGTDGDTNATFTTDYGTLTLDPATGQWTYEANPDAIKGLGKDETKIETFEVTVTDEHGATSTKEITVTLHGTNDTPWIKQTSIELKEQGVYDRPEDWIKDDANTSTTEKVGGTWIGAGEHKLSIEGDLSLNAGDLDVHDKLTYGINGLTTGNGSADSLNVAIKGSDPDAPDTVEVRVISSTFDPSNPHIQIIETNYGTLTLDMQTGKFTFDISGSEADKLAQGEELNFNFRTTVDDGNGGTAEHMLAVKIKGTNDRPTLDLVEPTHGDNVTVVTDDKTGEVKFDITEKADVANDTTVSGTLKSDDDDRGANLRYGVALGKQDVESEAGRNLAFDSGSDGKPGMGEPLHQTSDGKIEIEGTYGTLTIDPASNTYTYKTNENADKLGLNIDGTPQTGTDEFTIYVRDEHGAWTAKPISVTVTGSNDTPIITADAEHWVKEAGVVDTSTDHGTTTDTAKTPDRSDDSRELTGADTSLSRNGISGQVHVKDTDTTDTLTLNIGTKEGSGTIVNGSTTDADGNITLETKFGSIILHKDGTYTYTIDEDKTQSLSQGQTEKEIFTITVDDGHGGKASVDITINIVGTNDRPTLTLTPTSDTVVSDPGYDKDHNEVAEDLTVTGTFEGADPDSNPTLEFGVSTSAGNRDTAFDANGNNPGMGGGHHSATGTYGSLTIDPSTGEYTYTLDTAKGGAADKLGLKPDGKPEQGYDTFTIYVRDEHGAWSEQTVTITVNGSNDAPVIAKTENTLTVTESGFKADNTAVDTTHDVSKGSVNATDVDTSDQGKLTYYFSDKAHNPVTFGKGDVIGHLTLADGTKTEITVTSVKPDGTIVTDYGTFHLDTKTGEYTFTKAESTGNATDQLQLGDKVELDFSISVKDSHGETASSTHDVTVVINGSNDRPSATMQGITVKEAGVHDGNTATTADTDGTLGAGEHRVTSGTLNITNLKDVDDDISKGFGTGEDQFKISLRGSGNCGTPSHNADGTWTMTHLLSNGGDFNNVRATLFNSNFPKDAFDKLEAQLRAEGLLGQNQDLTYGNAASILSQVALGTLTVNPDGSYSFTLPPDGSAGSMIVNMFGADNSSNRTINFSVTDPHGKVSEEQKDLTINIHKPDNEGGWDGGAGLIIDADKSEFNGAVVEDGRDLSQTPDVTEGLIFEGQLHAKWDGEGHPGTPPDRVFGIEEKDEFGHGTGKQIQSSAADGFVTAEGKYGYLVVDPVTGKYTYTLYNGENGKPGKVQDLAEGQMEKEEFNVMLNGTPTNSKITITIHGTNDAPVIDSYQNMTIQEGDDGLGNLTTSETLKAHDIDNLKGTDGSFESGTETETLKYYFRDKDGNETNTLPTKYGTVTLTFDKDGNCTYTYTTDGAKLPDHLPKGESLPDSFIIYVRDAHGEVVKQEITVTINGTNHGPEVVPGEHVLNVVEDVTVSQEGNLNDIIKDDEGLNNLHFSINGKGTVVEGEYGTLHIDPATGKYIYTLNNADPEVQGLDAKSSIKETFTITVTDKHGETTTVDVTVNVKGTDDTPELTLGKVLSVREGDADAVGDTAVGFDKDIADQGHLTYSFGKDADGNPLTEITNEYGTFTIDPKTGAYTFTLDNTSETVLKMAAGRLYETSINVTVTDTSGLSDTKELVVNIEGTNTAPVITSGEHGVIIANPAPLVEDGGVSKVTGQVTAREYDEGDHVVAFKFVNDKGELVDSLTGKYGTISIDKDGNYTYTFNNGQAQHLGAGEMAHEHFNVVTVDTYGAQTTTPSDLQIQIQGTNDAPVITSPTPVLNLTELASGQAEITGTITFNDADKKADGTFYDTHTFSVRPTGAAETENGAAAEGKYGTLTIDEHGNYKYTLTSDALGEGDKYTETFTVTVDDGNGGKATQTITVNLTGTNDAPVITESHTANGTTGSFIFTDADVKADGSFYDTHSFAISVDGKAHGVTLDSTGTHGTVTIDGLGTFELTQGDGGNWHYAFTASPEAIAGAALGSLVTHDFQIIVNDGHATAMTPAGEDSLSVSFMGTGTPPADMDLGNLTPGMAQGDHLPGMDADGHQLAYAFDKAVDGNIQGEFGSLHFNAETGQYTYTLDTSEDGLHKLAQAQADGSALKESFGYTVSGHEGHSNGSLEINLTDLHTQLGHAGADTLGDQTAAHSQVIFGEGGDDVIHGGAGNDWLFGGEGDDQLFGGTGDDILYGGAGNDYLDGGTGHNSLYGGAGNDILVYNQGMAHASGGEGIDFLVGAEKDTLDSLFANPDNNPIQSDIEVLITSKPDSLSLTNLDDLKSIGISIEGDKLHLSGDWAPTAIGGEEHGISLGNYAEFTHHSDHGDITILVQSDTPATDDLAQQIVQNTLNHGQG